MGTLFLPDASWHREREALRRSGQAGWNKKTWKRSVHCLFRYFPLIFHMPSSTETARLWKRPDRSKGTEYRELKGWSRQWKADEKLFVDESDRFHYTRHDTRSQMLRYREGKIQSWSGYLHVSWTINLMFCSKDLRRYGWKKKYSGYVRKTEWLP